MKMLLIVILLLMISLLNSLALPTITEESQKTPSVEKQAQEEMERLVQSAKEALEKREKLVSFEAEGRAEGEPTKMVGIRTVAIKKALEKMIKALTIADVGREKVFSRIGYLEKRIFPRVFHFVRRYQVLETKKEEKGLILKVRATIYINILRKILAAEGFFLNKTGKLKLVMMLVEKRQEEETPRYWWNLPVEDEVVDIDKDLKLKKKTYQLTENEEIVTELFVKRNFESVDFGAEEIMAKIPSNLKKIDFSDEELKMMGNILGVDFVLWGKIWGVYSQEKRKHEQEISLKIFDVEEGKLISSVDELLQCSSAEYCQNKFKSLFPQLVKKLISKLEDKLEKKSFATQIIEVVTKGSLSYLEFYQIKHCLKKLSNIKDLEEEKMGGGEFIFSVSYSGKFDDLVKGIKGLEIEGLRLVVEKVSKERIDLRKEDVER